MEEFSSDKISEVLSSPDLMKNIQNVLSQITQSSGTNDIAAIEETQGGSLTDVIQALNNNGLMSAVTSFLSNNKAERIALLTALRPFLSEDKRVILDSVLQLLKVANILLATNILK